MRPAPTTPPGEAAALAAQGDGGRTQRYRSRRAAFVRAAVALINRKGVRGMTLAGVAAQLGVVPTAVIYYFANREALASACFLEAIEAYESLIRAAGEAPSPQARLRLLVGGYVQMARSIAEGRREPLVVFNDVRGLDDPAVNAAYVEMFRHARSLIAPLPPRGQGRQALNAATHLVLSQLFWSVVWLPRYELDDYDRVAARVLGILEDGLAADDADRSYPPLAPVGAPGDDVPRETFLRAATAIINEHGYAGASVDRISARLNVTKGSFYHHNDAKDDLVVACFRRTLEVMRRAQRRAIEEHESGWRRLQSCVSALVACQVSGVTPLLRTSALTSAPEAMQSGLVGGFERVSLCFASMISDGIADGSVRPVDPHIGAQMVTAAINAAAEIGYWTRGLPPADASEALTRALLQGLGSVLRDRASAP